MKKLLALKKSALRAFAATYDTAYEDAAFESRGAFLRAFPRSRLERLTLNDYVIGLGAPTFCDHVEAKTRPWAVIQGATAFKFGIYFGRTKSDARRMYRFSGKFGATKAAAFRSVKEALLELVAHGARGKPDFAAIDRNPLSQMFKAKILSLYFPERFLNVCSGEHLQLLGSKLGLADAQHLSELQNLLLDVKLNHRTTSGWSNPKFMRFLYSAFMHTGQTSGTVLERPERKSHRRIDFEDMQKQRAEIGRKAEIFALEWEKQRLIGADLEHLVGRIEDRRDRPSYGYDFLSHTSNTRRRYVEVKSVVKQGDGHRFFLSENELSTSQSVQHRGAYYFYLVTFDGKGAPQQVITVLARDIYSTAKLIPSSYLVRFKLQRDVES